MAASSSPAKRWVPVTVNSLVTTGARTVGSGSRESIPSCSTCPPAAAAFSAAWNEASAPVASITMSCPSGAGVSPGTWTAWSAPSSKARSSGRRCRSVSVTSAAPRSFRQSAVSSPIGPAPQTSTFRPATATGSRPSAWSTTASGSASTARAGGSPSGTSRNCSGRTATSSASPPLVCGRVEALPRKLVGSSANSVRTTDSPRNGEGHSGWTTTAVPAGTSSSPSRVGSVRVAQISWPSTMGWRTTKAPLAPLVA